jgi:carbon starvation protein
VATGSIGTIWPMFGIANQLLAVLALALVTTLLVNTGRARYAPVTLLPMLFVTSTTMTAGTKMLFQQFLPMINEGKRVTGLLNFILTLFVVISVALLLLMAFARWVSVLMGAVAVKPESPSFSGKPKAPA